MHASIRAMCQSPVRSQATLSRVCSWEVQVLESDGWDMYMQGAVIINTASAWTSLLLESTHTRYIHVNIAAARVHVYRNINKEGEGRVSAQLSSWQVHSCQSDIGLCRDLATPTFPAKPSSLFKRHSRGTDLCLCVRVFKRHSRGSVCVSEHSLGREL